MSTYRLRYIHYMYIELALKKLLITCERYVLKALNVEESIYLVNVVNNL